MGREHQMVEMLAQENSNNFRNLFLLFEVPLMDSWHFAADTAVGGREHIASPPHPPPLWGNLSFERYNQPGG